LNNVFDRQSFNTRGLSNHADLLFALLSIVGAGPLWMCQTVSLYHRLSVLFI